MAAGLGGEQESSAAWAQGGDPSEDAAMPVQVYDAAAVILDDDDDDGGLASALVCLPKAQRKCFLPGHH